SAKVAALAALPRASVVPALIAAHALSRGPLPAVTLFLPYARESGLAATAAVLALVIAFIGLPVADALRAVIVTIAAVAAMTLLARRQIGGYTGDVLGGAQQVAETALLLLLAVRHGAGA